MLGRGRAVEPASHTLGHGFLEEARLGLALGHRESRHQVSVLETDTDALGNQQRVVAGFGQVAEDGPHLGRRLEVELVRVELEPVRVIQRRGRLHTQQRRVCSGVAGVRVVEVIGCDEREIQLSGEAQQVVHCALLDVDSVVHDFGEEIVFAENVPEVRGRL